MSDILNMKGISKSFPGVKALDGVHLDVKKGTVHAVMGENGAGKSTLMKVLFGEYQPDEGEILFEGQKVQFKSVKDAVEHGISMIYHPFAVTLSHGCIASVLYYTGFRPFCQARCGTLRNTAERLFRTFFGSI